MSARARRRGGRRPDRRRFLQGSLAGLALARTPRLARPSDELRVAVVGLNGRGAEHVAALRALPGVQVRALCDVDDQVLAREGKRLRELTGKRPDLHADLRDLLERPDLDAVSIATPNHWHALQTIWACQAGKDVYLEKPLTHAFLEGAYVVEAARKYGRIVQSGFQSRASPAIRAALEWVRRGGLGELELVRGLCFKPRPSIGRVKGPQRLPESVDYDLWCGPAPLSPLRRSRLHYDWHWSFATGDGDLGNQGVHALDVARWALGDPELPSSVLSLGGRFGYEDDGETPNSLVVFYNYEPVPLLFEVRGLPKSGAAQAGDWAAGMDDHLGVRMGVVLEAAGGTLRIPDYARAVAHDRDGREIRRWEEAGDPFADWIAAVKSRRVEDLAADVEVGVASSALSHLGNASYRLGSTQTRAAIEKETSYSERLTDASRRLFTHLDANGVATAGPALRLGPCLVLDRERGCFQENPRGDALLAGQFREPYVLPRTV